MVYHLVYIYTMSPHCIYPSACSSSGSVASLEPTFGRIPMPKSRMRSRTEWKHAVEVRSGVTCDEDDTELYISADYFKYQSGF